MKVLGENDGGFWLAAYNDYLRSVVGAAPATNIRFSYVIRRFINTRLKQDTTVTWTSLSIEQIAEFVREEAASKKGHGRRVPMCAMRSFLRFLAWRGIAQPGMDRAIPRLRLSSYASLPPHLSPDQVMKLLDAATMSTAPRRDRAILLLLARLGLRSKEIIELEIGDIDWRAGTLRLRVGKSHRERELPLPQEVGAALAEYVRYDRPSTLSRTMFFSVEDPSKPFLHPSSITCLVKRNLKRAGIPLGRLTGAHMLRHTAASQLVNNGASLSEVADLLGHQWLVTTANYAKLDLETLAPVSLPWIGGRQ